MYLGCDICVGTMQERSNTLPLATCRSVSGCRSPLVVYIPLFCCAMSVSNRSLSERRAELDVAVREASADIRKQKRKDSRARNLGMRSHTFSVQLARVIWCMFSLAADPRGAVLHAVRNAKEKRRFLGATDGALLELAERSFLETDLDELMLLLDGDHPERTKALSLARRYLAEWDLFKWCTQLNENAAVAPSTLALLRRARMHVDVLPSAVFKVTSSGRPAWPARRWARRWRKRWGARVGTLRAREHHPIAELNQKVH